MIRLSQLNLMRVGVCPGMKAYRTAFPVSGYGRHASKFSTNTSAKISLHQMASRIFFRSIRAVRVVLLTLTVYQAGYQSGLITYAQNPKLVDENFLKGVLQGTGASGYTRDGSTEESARLNSISSRIVKAALQYCKLKSKSATAQLTEIAQQKSIHIEAEQKLRERLNQTIDSEDKKLISDQLNHIMADLRQFEKKERQTGAEIAEWSISIEKLSGEWQFLFTDSEQVNAFVTDLFPRRIFVNQGFLNRANPTDDELGLVLGHEISHLILKHTEKNNEAKTFIVVAQLAILTLIDPSGFFSPVADNMIATIASYISNAHSRHVEEEADALGIEIAAMACFDTKKGANIFKKLSDLENAHGPLVSWNSSHPNTESRYMTLLSLSEKYNRGPQCASYIEALQRAASFSILPPWMTGGK